MLWVKITILFLNLELGDTVKIQLVAGVKTHFRGKLTVQETSILWVRITHLFTNSKKINTVRLPRISSKNTHSWGKLTVK
jgi:hypothetical protein